MTDKPVYYSAVVNTPGGSLSGWRYGSVGLPYVYDLDASTHYAVPWLPRVGDLTFRNPANLDFGGVYSIILRCRSTVTQPPGASVTVNIRSDLNHPGSFDLSN